MNAKKIYLLFLWISIGILGRLIPHIANATPLTSLCLLSGTIFSRRFSLFLMLIILLLSDSLLGWIHHYPIWGSWSIFTYSGFLLITLLGTFFSFNKKIKNAILMVIISSLFFWIWTNLGVWLFSGIYEKTLSGFFDCYLMAIPFLKTALIGSVLWTLFLFFVICKSTLLAREARA